MCNCHYCTKNIEGVKRWIKEWESELERLKAKGITSGCLCSDNDDEVDFAICKTEISYALFWLKEII